MPTPIRLVGCPSPQAKNVGSSQRANQDGGMQLQLPAPAKAQFFRPTINLAAQRIAIFDREAIYLIAIFCPDPTSASWSHCWTFRPSFAPLLWGQSTAFRLPLLDSRPTTELNVTFLATPPTQTLSNVGPPFAPWSATTDVRASSGMDDGKRIFGPVGLYRLVT